MSLDDTAPLRPPPRAGFNMKAAMIVPGIGALILVAFIGAGFLTSNPIQPTKTSTSSFSVPGTPLRARPAAHDLKVITVNGQPPGNIINAVSVPVGATRVSFVNHSAAAQQYDAQIVLKANQSQGAVDKFFTEAMKKQGWQIFDTGPADHDPGALEVLGKKAGSDGFFWEMGSVVSATTFGADGPAGGTTSFTVRLFQQPDPD
jgi:hypothetical protein